MDRATSLVSLFALCVMLGLELTHAAPPDEEPIAPSAGNGDVSKKALKDPFQIRKLVPPAELTNRVMYLKDPVSGLMTVHFRDRVRADEIATLKQRQDLGTLFFSTMRHPITDEDLKLVAEVPMRGLFLNRAPITDKGIAHLKGHPQLESIYIEKLNVTNECVNTLATIPNLNRVQFFYSSIGDVGLAKLAEMQQLRRLNFYKCDEITDEGVIALSRLPQLEGLSLGYCAKITRRVIKPLCNLKELNDLGVGGIKLTPEDAHELTALTKLTSLGLSKGVTSDEIIEKVAHLTTLESLVLADTDITDACVASLTRLKKLKKLDVSITSLTDEGAKGLLTLSELEYLNLSHTKVTDAGLSELPKVTKVKHLMLDETGVTPALSPLLEKMKSLEVLYVQDTAFTTQDIERLFEKLPNLKTVFPMPQSARARQLKAVKN